MRLISWTLRNGSEHLGLSIYSSLHTSERSNVAGRICTVNTIHLEVPAVFHTSLVLHMVYRVSDKKGFSKQLFCDWGRR
jgi:hypothetical protein